MPRPIEDYRRADGSVVGQTPSPPPSGSSAAGRGATPRGSFLALVRLRRKYGERWDDLSQTEKDGLVALEVAREARRR
jgi:hypothetical protein